MEALECPVDAAGAGSRADAFVAGACGVSRAAAQRLLEQGLVRLNGTPVLKGRRLAEGDCLLITLPPPEDSTPRAQAIPLDVLYEDDALLVVNKPKGMVTHPAPGSMAGTLVNALLHRCGAGLSALGGPQRPGIVHRIDKDTSGLLVVAKDDAAHAALAAQFKAHSVLRVYNAVVYGAMPAAEGRIDAPIGRDAANRKRMAVTDAHAKRAVTVWRVLGAGQAFSHLQLRLLTGRTHQIRVHMAQMGHPLAGDGVYGPKKVLKKLGGQCLHAGVLGFTHPQTGRRLSFTSPLPQSFALFLKSAGIEETEPAPWPENEAGWLAGWPNVPARPAGGPADE